MPPKIEMKVGSVKGSKPIHSCADRKVVRVAYPQRHPNCHLHVASYWDLLDLIQISLLVALTLSEYLAFFPSSPLFFFITTTETLEIKIKSK